MEMINIKTDQEAAVWIIANLIEQKQKSVDPITDECKYRGLDEINFEKNIDIAVTELAERGDIDIRKGEKPIDLINAYLNGSYHEDDAEYEDRIESIYYQTYQYIANNQDKFNSTKCAVGHVIRDEYYNPSMEGNTIDGNEVAAAVELSNPEWKITEASLIMLSCLQTIHDRIEAHHWHHVFDRAEDVFIFDDDGNFLPEKSFNFTVGAVEYLRQNYFNFPALYDKFNYNPNM